jgi:hypothetical protein
MIAFLRTKKEITHAQASLGRESIYSRVKVCTSYDVTGIPVI